MADDGQQNFMAQMMLGGMYGPNQYSHFPGGLTQPGFTGTPTDALGNPIQSFVDAQKAHDAWTPPAAPAPGHDAEFDAGESLPGWFSGRCLPQSSNEFAGRRCCFCCL